MLVHFVTISRSYMVLNHLLNLNEIAFKSEPKCSFFYLNPTFIKIELIDFNNRTQIAEFEFKRLSKAHEFE